jgi:hypothetical protein
VFGGRPTGEFEMVGALYELTLPTLTWHKRSPPPNPDPATASPRPRYFHSCTPWRRKLIVIGGQTPPTPASPPQSLSPEVAELETLADLAIWDMDKQEWSMPNITCAEGVTPPAARYAHLAVVSEVVVDGSDDGEGKGGERVEARLTLLGGQDTSNKYLNQRHVLDLDKMEWSVGDVLGRSVGGYRSVAVAADATVEPLQVSDGLERSSASRRPTKEAPEPIVIFTNAGGAQ